MRGHLLAPPAKPGVRHHQRLAMLAASFPAFRYMAFFFKPLFQAMPHGVETDINRRLANTPSVARWRDVIRSFIPTKEPREDAP